MARILLAWEMGLGLGHLVRLHSLARELSARGNELLLAARDLSQVRNVFGNIKITLLAAPWNSRRGRKIEPVATYADLLFNTGFGNASALAAHVDAWHSLFALVRPDLMICDHSPTALLAARGGSFSVATVGTGFCTPIDESPLRLLREVPPEQRADVYTREQQVLDVMNAVLQKHSLPALHRVTECYRTAVKRFLMTFTELDHFVGRANGDYRGAWPFAWDGQPLPQNRKDFGVFAYLKPFPALFEFLAGLSAKPFHSLVYIDGAVPVQTAKLSASRLQIADGPVDIRKAADRCELAVTNATHGTGVAMLLAGKPLVQVPIYLEQALFAGATDRLGASITVSSKNPHGILDAIDRIRAEQHYTQAARSFAERYRTHHLQGLAQEICDELEQLIAIR
jgi:hypothetical protein